MAMPCPLGHQPNLPHQARILASLQSVLTEKEFPHISLSDPHNPRNSATLFHIWLTRMLPVEGDMSSFSIAFYIEKCGCMLVDVDGNDKAAQDAVDDIRSSVTVLLEAEMFAQDALAFLKDKMKEIQAASRPRRPGRERDRNRLPPRRK